MGILRTGPAGGRLRHVVRAREIGGARMAATVMVGSVSAVVASALRAAGRPPMQNAVRHFAWSAWLSARYGEEVATAVTEAHEQQVGRPLDSETDRRNNAAGRRHGRRHPVGGPVPLAVWRYAGAGVRRWEAGRLWMVVGAAVARSGRSRA